MNETKWYIVIPDGSPGTLILTDVPPDEYVRRATYLPLLCEHHRGRGDVKPGLYSSRVEHDDWCGLLKGGACNCSPTIISGPPIRTTRQQRRQAEREQRRRERRAR